MKKLLKRPSFTLWLVPADGQIRKVRLSIGRVVVMAVLGGSILGGFMFLAGDYARIQLLRAKSYLSLKLAERERQTLQNSQHALQDKLRSFQQQHGEVLQLEKNMNEQLAGLRAIVRSSEALGIVPRAPKNRANQKNLETSKALPNKLTQIEDPKEDDSAGIVVSSKPGLGGAESTKTPLYTAYSSSPRPSQLDDAHPLAFENGVEIMSPVVEELKSIISRLRKAPLYLPSNTEILSGFGYRMSPFGEGIRFHEGLDFNLQYKSDVLSSGNGVVQDVSRHGTYGLMIDIEHSNGVVSRYAHLSKSFVTVGQEVIAGDRIALSGSSGRSTGPHLHYEVLVRNVPIDPRRVFELSLKLAKLLD